jgi:hypothetical protein
MSIERQRSHRASHQTGWTGLVADLIRRRHGAVQPLGYVLRATDPLAAASRHNGAGAARQPARITS